MENNHLNTIKKAIENSVFCFASRSGQGFIEKTKCQCYLAGQTYCDAYFEQLEFYKLYSELEKQGLTKNQIIEDIKGVFQWDKTSWIQYNVKD
ncbi:hypothetical protein [Niallia sp. MER 6]|uniref:hypothetical protein n=1 Tax=Niallia sp. MER 6 TaxID=2939567 RepID=UPI00203A4746|nr:hypothetical protein [Niallia sp. MER 6]MCM3029821.1 hypothetical protein [Niallia sp. MER 6]